MDALGSSAYHFTLTPSELDPNLDDNPTGLYGDAVSALLAAVARCFRGPVYAVAEVGKGHAGRRGRLHVHVVGHRDDGPQHVRRNSKRCEPVYDVLGLYRYLNKPPEPWNPEAELDAAAARALRPSGRLPNTRRHLVTTERLAWTAGQCSRNQSPPTQPEPRLAPDAAPPLDEPNAAPKPQLPTRPTVSSSTSRPSRLFGNLVDRLVVITAPSAPPGGRRSSDLFMVSRSRPRRRPRARGPPGSASTAPQPLDLSYPQNGATP